VVSCLSTVHETGADPGRRLGRGWRTLGWLLLPLGCSTGGPTPWEAAVQDFVDTWAAGVPACDAQAVCGAFVSDPCQVAALPSEQIEQGVIHSHFDVNAITRCQESMLSFAACLASLDCDTLPDADVHCPVEHERYTIDCAGFSTALDYLYGEGTGGAGSGTGGAGSGGSGDGGSGATGTGGAGAGGVEPGSGGAPASGGSSTGGAGSGGRPATGGAPSDGGSVGTGGEAGGGGGAPAQLAGVLCDRAEECSRSDWSESAEAVCESEAIALIGPLVPDAMSAEVCLERAPCQQLTSNAAAWVAGCVDLDPSQSECVGSTTLRACTPDGACADHSCRDVCAASRQLTYGCEPATSGLGDACVCGVP